MQLNCPIRIFSGDRSSAQEVRRLHRIYRTALYAWAHLLPQGTTMSKLVPLLFLVVSISVPQERPSQGNASLNYGFVNGKWFDDQKFVPQTFYSVNGVLSLEEPQHVDSTIDLNGKYVVPPYAEAHNHNIDGFKNVEDRIKRYLADGIYYVKNPNSIPERTATLTGKVNLPSSLDVVFSNGGLTATGGHPLELVRRNIGLGIFTDKDAEGGMYYIIDSVGDLNHKWAGIKAGTPDFIKTYLLYSEEFLKRRDDTAYFGWKGLDPAVLPMIVERAHHDSLRVSTHVETAADFHNALAAGVDEINHLPGFRADSTLDFARYEISERDARDAARKHVVVVTTLAAAASSGSTGYQESLRLLHVTNLRLLKKCGVAIAIGSDSYRQTSVPEAMYIKQLGVFTNAELLRMWSGTTAETIFPQRKIGHLRPGFEASFLVLDDDPLQDFSSTQKILLRFKNGVKLPGENFE